MYTAELLEAYQKIASLSFGDELRMYDKMRESDPDKKYECLTGPEEAKLVADFDRIAKKVFQESISLPDAYQPPDVDVIILAYSKDEKYYEMCCETIRSLKLSASPNVKLRILVVESNQDAPKQFPAPLFEGSHVLIPDEPFKYNRFLKLGYDWLKASNVHGKYLLVLNNDITAFCPYFANRLLYCLEKFDCAFGIDFRDSFRLGLEKSCEQLVCNNYARYFGWCFMVKYSLFDKHPFEQFFPQDILFYNQDVYFVKLLEKLDKTHVIDLCARAWHRQHVSHCLRSDMIRETCENAEFAGGQLKHLEISSSDHAPHQKENDPGISMTPKLKAILGDSNESVQL